MDGSSDPAEVIALLERFDTTDPQQLEVRDSMLAFARAHADCLDRTCAPGHFTASALVVERGTDRFVVLLHTKLGKWLQPGGHVDGSSDMPVSALREATEETGLADLVVVPAVLDLDIHRVEPPKEHPHDHLDLRFLVLAPAGSQLVGNHESRDIRWVTIDELESLGADVGLVRLARVGLARASAIED